jgi:hypothetical protein
MKTGMVPRAADGPYLTTNTKAGMTHIATKARANVSQVVDLRHSTKGTKMPDRRPNTGQRKRRRRVIYE